MAEANIAVLDIAGVRLGRAGGHGGGGLED